MEITELYRAHSEHTPQGLAATRIVHSPLVLYAGWYALEGLLIDSNTSEGTRHALRMAMVELRDGGAISIGASELISNVLRNAVAYSIAEREAQTAHLTAYTQTAQGKAWAERLTHEVATGAKVGA